MRRYSRLFLIIFIICSVVSFIFYWLLYLQAISINKTSNIEDSLSSHKLEQRLNALESSLKDNQIVLNILNTKIRNYINKIRSGKSFPSPRADHLCSSDRNGEFEHFQHIRKFDNYQSPPFDLEKSTNLTSTSLYDKLPFDNPDGGVWKQGWDVKIDEKRFDESKPLKVFVVPHSHNDPGWLKTFDQYYKDQTEQILENILEYLSEHSAMKFIWAEISYFARWYDNLRSEDKKEMVKTLLDSGQLEVTTGGWVMTDEANTHYFAMISQMVDGHEWLVDRLGYRPKYGWAIDPFGYSPTMAFLLKKMGLKGMVIQRVHYAVKRYLAKNHLLEFNWKQQFEPNDLIENSKGILSHVMPFYSYDISHSCGPDPKVVIFQSF